MLLADLESIFTICMLISAATILLLWYLKGYDGDFNTKGELYKLPKELSTLDAGFLLKGEAKEKDVNSLLLYLASNGYLRIEEIKNSFQLVKLKTYKKKDEIKIFFDELFKNRDTVIEDELVDSFYKVTDEIRHFKNDITHVNNLYFYNNAFYVMIADLIVIVNLFLTVTIVFLETLGNNVNYGLICLFMIFYIASYLPLKAMKSNITKYIYRLLTLFCLFFILIVGFNLTNNAYTINLLINIIMLMFMNTLILIMPKRNKEGHKYFGQIKRFKNTINDLNESKLKELLKEDKNYVFDIFPYAYTLGVANRLLDVYTAVDKRGPKYVKMLNDRDARKNFNFLRKVTNNLDRRKGDEYY